MTKVDPVYPGHPVLLALQIMQEFTSLADANRRTSHGWPAALSSSAVTGAGGPVYDALEILHLARSDPQGAYLRGCEMWRDSRTSDFSHKMQEGIDAAERHKQDFLEACEKWGSQSVTVSA